MTSEVEDELWQSALLRIRLQHGLVQFDARVLEDWVANTLEGRAAAEIKRLKSRLSGRMATAFGATVVSQPMANPRYRSAIVACARWESDNIVEWATYHASLGFDHIYLYCNDDDPTELYEKLYPWVSGDAPFISFLHYPLVGLQTAMYKHFLKSSIQETEWVFFLDVDEFVALKQHRDINAFIADYAEDSDAIYFNWVFFGHSGHVTRPPGNILTQYIKRDRYVNPFTKVLTRTSSLDVKRVIEDGETGFWHDWKDSLAGGMRRVNVLREDMTGYYVDFPNTARRRLDDGDRHKRILDTAAIYHFAFRSERDIDRRIHRGVGGDFGGQLAFKGVADRGEIASFLAPFNDIEDTFLRDYWRRLMAKSQVRRVIPAPPGKNLALGKSATQSSVCQWSTGKTTEEDAARAVSGIISGSGAFHTDIEDHPWWRVDLADACLIGEVRLYNRMDSAAVARRTSRFRLQVSLDGHFWQTVFTRTDEAPFGGVDGEPFIWRADTPVVARFVQVQLLETQFLHLDQVEVYGESGHVGPEGG